MLIGLDVGGTHTDAALLEPGNGRRATVVKARTNPEDLLSGILEALGELLRGKEPGRVRRLCVSTTLGLNALLTGKGDRVGMLAVPGPGIDPQVFWRPDPLFRVISGSQDHRGRIVAPPDEAEVTRVLRELLAEKVVAIGIVCKFSPKNPEMEHDLAAIARKVCGDNMPVVLGCEVSGSLNFPRRLHTVWCNAALSGLGNSFIRSLLDGVSALGLICPVTVLKADAGVFSAEQAARDPASTMGSGPAASLLGVWALSPENSGDTLMIDMGGTSTDLALLAGGIPLLAGKGLNVDERPTLIRSLWTRSIALGGDSVLRIADGAPCIGTDCFRLAGDHVDADTAPPTLTDALNVLGLTEFGDSSHSLRVMRALAETAGTPESDPTALSDCFALEALRIIRCQFDRLLEEVNAQPVYTIRELLVNDTLQPQRAVFIGGPAKALAGKAENILGIPVLAPEESGCANAVGAALALPTMTAELYADTLLGRMSIPEFGVSKAVGGGYTLAEAKKDMQDAFSEAGARDAASSAAGCGTLLPAAAEQGAAQVVYAESFAMLDDGYKRGRVIRLRAQLSAGLLPL